MFENDGGFNLEDELSRARAKRDEKRAEAAKDKHFDLVAFDRITFDAAPAYHVKDLLCSTGLIVVWGPPKCGKSFFVFDLVMHVALGWEYRGRRVRQGTVVYCALEGCAAFKNRVEAFRQKHLAEHATDVPFYLMASPMSLVSDQPALVASIMATLGKSHPAIVVIDTLNRSLAGSESSDEDMSKYIQAADALRDVFNCTVVIIHHCGHEGTRPRGHSSLMGALDVQIGVVRDAANNIVATVELMKDGQEGAQITNRLEAVEVGTDQDGDKITSCVIVPADGAVSKKANQRKKPTGAAKTALEALHYAISECGAVPPSSRHIPANVKCVKVEEWRTYAYLMGVSPSDEADSKLKAFQRASGKLIAENHVSMWDKDVWPCM
jgi:hypothetical protein